MPIQKALLVDGKNKVVSHLICGEYELTNTSGLNYRRNTMLVEIKYTPSSNEEEDLEVPNTDKRDK